MISHAEAQGEAVHVLVKVWVDGTRDQKNRWHKLALASFLLGTRGRSTFSFSYGPTYDTVPLERWWRIPLGEASGPRFATQGVRRRNYSNGVVLVNPGERKHVVQLGGRFVNLRGQIRTSVRMPAHTGRILLKA
jgi:hypothetical protein